MSQFRGFESLAQAQARWEREIRALLPRTLGERIRHRVAPLLKTRCGPMLRRLRRWVPLG